MKSEAGARPEAPFFLVLLTDGKSQDDAIAAANRLKNAGVEIIAVGETEKYRRMVFSLQLWKTHGGVTVQSFTGWLILQLFRCEERRRS